MKRLKAYKYSLDLTEEQKVQVNQHIGCVRYIYNWGLEKKIKQYQKTKKNLDCFTLINLLPKLKEEYEWLKDCDSQALQMALRNLDNAFKNFFRKQNNFPKFKSKKEPAQSYQLPQRVKKLQKGDKKIQIFQIPKLGKTKVIFHREFDGKIKTCTISRKSTGKYFISILVEEEVIEIKLKKIKEKTTIGIDLGIKDFAILSTEEKIANPKYLKNSLNKLAVVQRRFSKKKKINKDESLLKEKMKLKIALLHEHVTNQRKDFLHKVSHKLTHDKQVDTICVEDLNVKGMIKNRKLSKAINDVSWGKFKEFLTYKCDWYGKNLVTIGRFQPSSKMCSCGYINKDLTLADREWVCEECGVKHDRDILAAQNIKRFGLIQSGNDGTRSHSK